MAANLEKISFHEDDAPLHTPFEISLEIISWILNALTSAFQSKFNPCGHHSLSLSKSYLRGRFGNKSTLLNEDYVEKI